MANKKINIELSFEADLIEDQDNFIIELPKWINFDGNQELELSWKER